MNSMTPSGQPATDVTYTWSNVRVYVTAAANGTELSGTLKVEQDGCTAEYAVEGLYPAVSCLVPPPEMMTPDPPPANPCADAARRHPTTRAAMVRRATARRATMPQAMLVQRPRSTKLGWPRPRRDRPRGRCWMNPCAHPRPISRGPTPRLGNQSRHRHPLRSGSPALRFGQTATRPEVERRARSAHIQIAQEEPLPGIGTQDQSFNVQSGDGCIHVACSTDGRFGARSLAGSAEPVEARRGILQRRARV